MAGFLSNLVQIVAPKSKGKKSGVSSTPTFNATAPQNLLTIPQYKDHLNDIFDTRQSSDSRTLLRDLFKFDPDMSATVHANLMLANTEPIIVVRDLMGEIDRDATKSLMLFIKMIFSITDYTLGFQLKPNLIALCENLRYMGMLRGAIGAELVLNDKLIPADFRVVDMSTIRWFEQKTGVYKPQQLPKGSNTLIDLDIPTFFVSFYRRDPTSIYGESSMVAAINTIAARQQVINDLYRIMRVTGFPRMDLKVVEEVVLKNAPANVRTDAEKLKAYRADRLREITNLFTSIRPDQAFVHFDAVEASILNDQTPGVGIDISSVIDTLNAQNQAGMKTMSTVIGRGNSGVNTSSVEARIAAMTADELNEPIAELLSNAFSFILHSNGYQGFAEVKFRNAELRPDLELEPQRVMKASRLQTELSLGLITDDEYHFELHGRLRPDSSPLLQGTGFMQPQQTSVNAQGVTPNSDPLGRSLVPAGSDGVKSNTVKKPK